MRVQVHMSAPNMGPWRVGHHRQGRGAPPGRPHPARGRPGAARGSPRPRSPRTLPSAQATLSDDTRSEVSDSSNASGDTVRHAHPPPVSGIVRGVGRRFSKGQQQTCTDVGCKDCKKQPWQVIRDANLGIRGERTTRARRTPLPPTDVEDVTIIRHLFQQYKPSKFFI